MTRCARVAGHAMLVVLVGCGPLLPEGQEVVGRSGGDVLAAGRRVVVTDSLPGDALMAGRTVEFSGTAGGSVIAAGAETRVGGHALGNVIVAGGSVPLTGTTGRNLIAAGMDVSVARSARVDRNAYLTGRRVEHRGSVSGALRIMAREVVLDGTVHGDVDVIAERLTVGADARVGGTLEYRVEDGALSVDPAAQIAGGVTGIAVLPRSPWPGLLFRAMRLVAFLVAGGVAVLLFRTPLDQAARMLRHAPLPAFGLGALWIVLVPVLVFATFVTVFGIPLAVIGALVFLVALYLGPVVPAVALGRGLLGAEGPGGKTALASFLAGGLLLGLAMLLPWVGFPIRVLATAGAFGGVVLALRDAPRI